MIRKEGEVYIDQLRGAPWISEGRLDENLAHQRSSADVVAPSVNAEEGPDEAVDILRSGKLGRLLAELDFN